MGERVDKVNKMIEEFENKQKEMDKEFSGEDILKQIEEIDVELKKRNLHIERLEEEMNNLSPSSKDLIAEYERQIENEKNGYVDKITNEQVEGTAYYLAQRDELNTKLLVNKREKEKEYKAKVRNSEDELRKALTQENNALDNDINKTEVAMKLTLVCMNEFKYEYEEYEYEDENGNKMTGKRATNGDVYKELNEKYEDLKKDLQDYKAAKQICEDKLKEFKDRDDKEAEKMSKVWNEVNPEAKANEVEQGNEPVDNSNNSNNNEQGKDETENSNDGNNNSQGKDETENSNGSNNNGQGKDETENSNGGNNNGQGKDETENSNGGNNNGQGKDENNNSNTAPNNNLNGNSNNNANKNKINRIEKVGFEISEAGIPVYYAVLISKQGNKPIRVDVKNLNDLEKIGKYQNEKFQEQGIEKASKYYDTGIASLLSKIDKEYATNFKAQYDEDQKHKFEYVKNGMVPIIPVEYDFSNLYSASKEDKEKLKYLKKIAKANKRIKVAKYTRPSITKFLKSLASKLNTKSLPQGEGNKEERLENNYESKSHNTTRQDVINAYNELHNEPEFNIEDFIETYHLSEQEAEDFRRLQTSYQKRENFKQEMQSYEKKDYNWDYHNEQPREDKNVTTTKAPEEHDEK